MRNWKLFGKIGAIALTALGLALVPGNFNVPGVGTVQAFASAVTDLSEMSIEATDVTITGGRSVDYTGQVIDPKITEIAFKETDNEDKTGTVDLNKVNLKWKQGGSEVSVLEVGTYDLEISAITAAGYTKKIFKVRKNGQKYVAIKLYMKDNNL